VKQQVMRRPACASRRALAGVKRKQKFMAQKRMVACQTIPLDGIDLVQVLDKWKGFRHECCCNWDRRIQFSGPGRTRKWQRRGRRMLRFNHGRRMDAILGEIRTSVVWLPTALSRQALFITCSIAICATRWCNSSN